MADLMLVENPHCSDCRNRPCFRALCRSCAAYLSRHAYSKSDAKRHAASWEHDCRPQGRPYEYGRYLDRMRWSEA